VSASYVMTHRVSHTLLSSAFAPTHYSFHLVCGFVGHGNERDLLRLGSLAIPFLDAGRTPLFGSGRTHDRVRRSVTVGYGRLLKDDVQR
jgi:hypothetical protein